jgi:hypothetical protein
VSDRPQNKHLKPFKKGEVANPTGRPKKSVRAIIEEMKAAGHEPVKAVDVTASIEYLLSLDKDQLSDIAKDPKRPIILQITAREILDGKKGFNAVQTLLDRAHGKATQKVAGVDGDGKMVPLQVVIQAPNADLPSDD